MCIWNRVLLGTSENCPSTSYVGRIFFLVHGEKWKVEGNLLSISVVYKNVVGTKKSAWRSIEVYCGTQSN